MSYATETQVCSPFKCLNDHKSSLDIPNELIKMAAQPFSIPLTYIYNQSIETHKFPQCIRVVMLQTLAAIGL